MANQTTVWFEPIFVNKADGPSVNTSAVETALLATGQQPWLYPGFFSTNVAASKLLRIEANGVMGTTATPSYTWFVRLTTAQNVITGGVILGQSAAIVTATSTAGTYWELDMTVICNTPGIGANQATLTSGGRVSSPAGFSTPFSYALEPTTPPTATWTNTIDGSVSQYIMLSVNPGTSSASNTAQIKTLRVTATTL